jgi:dienelactone hydrolase
MPGGESGSDNLTAIVGLRPPMAAEATRANPSGKTRKVSADTAGPRSDRLCPAKNIRQNCGHRELPSMPTRLGPLVAGLLLSSIAAAGPIVSIPGPVDREGTPAGRQLWRVPSTDPDVLMFTTVFRPAGTGPFPLVVMNHGTTQDPVQRQYFPLLEFEAAALWFVRQGFVVAAPQRPGHGDTGGVFLEDEGDCSAAAFLAAGRAGAANIAKTIDYMTDQSFVRSDHVIVVGQSAGGWDTLALVSKDPGNLRLAINFDGGRGGHFQGRPNNNCRPDQLVDATRILGATAHVPTLWIYTKNDSFFGPQLSKQMVDAWRAAGGNAEYHLFPAFKQEGHLFVDYPQAVPVWAPIVKHFLAAHP